MVKLLMAESGRKDRPKSASYYRKPGDGRGYKGPRLILRRGRVGLFKAHLDKTLTPT
jgi:hypothetical protein